MKCPHCQGNIDVQLIKAPANLQPETRPNGSGNSLEEMLDAIDDSKLTGKPAEFVAETRAKFQKYKGNVYLSEKQMAWLRKLAYGEDEAWS